uniref:DUF4371 domain-containing protein n=1 Tax=Trichuris muris TaxID=70415 RepID=A0A5S6QHI3_TRIMR
MKIFLTSNLFEITSKGCLNCQGFFHPDQDETPTGCARPIASLLIAKCGKPHAIGEELILPAVSEVLRTVVRMPANETIKKIPLSNNTVQRRIDEMNADVENTLSNVLRAEKVFLQVDESTLPQNEALLLAYDRFIKEGKMVQELLFARELLTDTRGESIFRTVEKVIPLTNVIAVATDGAPSMLGRHRGFLSYLKEKVPDLLACTA